MRTTQTFHKTEYGTTFDATAYTDDGKVWRWASNDSVAPLDACQGYAIPCDRAAQEAARAAEVTAVIAEYRKNQKPPTPEELAEMRAAFGEGQVVVDIFTGRKTQL